MKYAYIAFAMLSSILSDRVFAADNTGILSGSGITEKKLREGDINFTDIPHIIKSATDLVLGFSATIAVIMIIYGAFQMSLMGLTAEDKKQGSNTIQHGIIGFVIAASAWFIVNIVIANL